MAETALQGINRLLHCHWDNYESCRYEVITLEIHRAGVFARQAIKGPFLNWIQKHQ